MYVVKSTHAPERLAVDFHQFVVGDRIMLKLLHQSNPRYLFEVSSRPPIVHPMQIDGKRRESKLMRSVSLVNPLAVKII